MRREGEDMEDDRSTMGRLRAAFLRALRACAGSRACRPEGTPETAIKDLPFSCDGRPGQEADYPVIQRLLWRWEKRKKTGRKKSKYYNISLDTFA